MFLYFACAYLAFANLTCSRRVSSFLISNSASSHCMSASLDLLFIQYMSFRSCLIFFQETIFRDGQLSCLRADDVQLSMYINGLGLETLHFIADQASEVWSKHEFSKDMPVINVCVHEHD